MILSKKATTYFQAESRELQSVFAKIKTLQELSRHVLPLLEPHIAPYCQVANIINSRLVLIVANGSIATQLRFLTPDLLKKMAAHPALNYIRDIQCKVVPSSSIPTKNQQATTTSTTMPLLSTDTANILNDIANSIPDSLLQNIMKRICQHTKNR